MVNTEIQTRAIVGIGSETNITLERNEYLRFMIRSKPVSYETEEYNDLKEQYNGYTWLS